MQQDQLQMLGGSVCDRGGEKVELGLEMAGYPKIKYAEIFY